MLFQIQCTFAAVAWRKRAGTTGLLLDAGAWVGGGTDSVATEQLAAELGTLPQT